jgi:hypothetical protein
MADRTLLTVTGGWQPASPAEVVGLLEAGDRDDQLVGVYERSWLDFKATYHFASLRSRWEFAKDVAAMAESGGGVIVVGVQAEKDPDRDEERACKVAPVPHAMFDVKRAYDIVSEDVYPGIVDVDIRPHPREDGKRIVSILVPAQDEDRKPFMLERVVTDVGAEISAFALPRRSGSHTVFEKVGFVHRDIADGRRARRSVSDTRLSPEESHRWTDAPPDAVVRVADAHLQDAERRALELATTIDRQADLTDVGVVYLAAVPVGQRPRPHDFFKQDGLRRAMSPRHQLREAGFGLTYGIDVRAAARSLLSIDEDRTVLFVETNGTTLAGAAGTPDFLAWAHQNFPAPAPVDGRPPLRINPVALNEWVYEFCRFTERELAPRWGRDGWVIVSVVRRARTADRPLVLPVGYSSSGAWLFQPQPAETDERVEAFAATLDPPVDAAAVLGSIYSLFGLSLDNTPFVVDGRFDENVLIRL